MSDINYFISSIQKRGSIPFHQIPALEYEWNIQGFNAAKRFFEEENLKETGEQLEQIFFNRFFPDLHRYCERIYLDFEQFKQLFEQQWHEKIYDKVFIRLLTAFTEGTYIALDAEKKK